MIIAYVGDIDISQPTGPGVNEREFVWTLQTESELRGDHIHILIPRPSKPLDFDIKNVLYYRTKIMKKCFGAVSRIVRTTWHLSLLILKLLRRSHVDLFVIRLNQRCLFIPILLSILGQKYTIKTLGNIYGFNNQSEGRLDNVYLFFLRRVLGVVLRRAVFIDVCTSQFHRNYKNIYTLQRIEVIENSVNTERFHPMDKEFCRAQCGVQRFNKVVGYSGGHPSLRGARQLVEISPDLIARYPTCGVVIIGDDAALSSLKARARELETDGHIVFTGIVDYELLNPYLNCFDVGVALDTSDRVKFVGNASQKIRQYLACGIPVIVPRSTNEQITSCGLGRAVTPNDLTDIFDAISFWFDMSRQEQEDLRMRARGFAIDTFSTRNTYSKRYTAWQKAIVKRVD